MDTQDNVGERDFKMGAGVLFCLALLSIILAIVA
jgi:hypothetical protein